MLPMTMWLTLLLLAGAWTRPIAATARVWVLSLPLFSAPERAACLAWLGPALAEARLGKTVPSPPGTSRGLVACYGPLALLAAYILAFIFVPAVRTPNEALDKLLPAVDWVYAVMGAWYPPVTREPAHILALGHPQDAYDLLRHFIAAVLVFSLSIVFVALSRELPCNRSVCAGQTRTPPHPRFAIGSSLNVDHGLSHGRHVPESRCRR